MFCGSFRYVISDKNELTLPIHFRQGRKKAVIGLWPEGCIFLFSKREWKRVMRMKRSRLFLSREEGRIIFSRVSEVEITERGKVRIPENLKQEAGLEREAIVAGCGKYIEIWDNKRWKIESERTMAMVRLLYDGETVAVPLRVSSN